jgi:N-acetylmuramoyl-L-alanine amidase
MKQLLHSLCIGSVALALCAPGAMAKEKDKAQKGKSAAAHGQAVAAARSHGQRGKAISSARSHGQRGIQQSSAHRQNVMRATRATTMANRDRVRTNRERTVREVNAVNRNQVRERNLARNRQAEFAARNTVRERNNVAVSREQTLRANRTRDLTRTGRVQVTNNWRGDRFSGQNYAAFRNYNRQWHNRDWYHSHYDRIVFISGGWWYWNTGYWYPAWGYAPHAYYPYDGPIYTGYAYLTPHEIVVNAQVQLRRDGYYAGSVDGMLGPMTRRALAAFQFDHGLAVTSAIDQPTASMLGVS